MATSDKILSDAIRAAVRRMFRGPDRDSMTVNKIREQIETELELDVGFLKQGSWKQESKNIVKTESDKLLQLEDASGDLPSVPATPAEVKTAPPKNSTPGSVKKGVKRSSNGDKAQGQKRQKKDATPIDEDEDEDSALTSIENTPEETEDSDPSDAQEPKKSRKSTDRPAPKELGNQRFKEREEKKKHEPGTRERLRVPDSKSSKEKIPVEGDAQGDNRDEPGRKTFRDGGVNGPTFVTKGSEVEAQSDSEMSVVLDEAPKGKRKSSSTSKRQPSVSTSKSSKPHKAAKLPPNISPDEAEVKILQSQLAMCGVRKIWGVVLKDYGSNTKAKIQYLKGMLKDIGMDGRFSKQKAEEIKEARELRADLEAVKEGEAIWGMGRGARSKKVSGGKKKAEVSDDEEDSGVGARSRSVSEKPPTRLARAKMDLAFLGDESESDD